MTCHECELALGMEQSSPALELHLAGCVWCQELRLEIQGNAEAFRALASDPLPSLRARGPLYWPWTVAAAAILVLAFGMSRMWRVEKFEPPPLRVVLTAPPVVLPPAKTPMKHRLRPRSKPAEPLMVKMFTSDPDVVIYWLIDPKKGSE